jgi:glycogen debranching enzyme
MDKILKNQAQDQFHTSPDSVNSDDQMNLLNHSNTFALFDRWGNIIPNGKLAQGIYHQGTRFLNTLILSINGQKPLLLSSSVKEDNDILSVDLANPVFEDEHMDGNAIHIRRNQFIRESAYYEEIICKNYCDKTHTFHLRLAFDGDFKDIFEIRGTQRKVATNEIKYLEDRKKQIISYLGLDGLLRQAIIEFNTTVDFSIHNQTALFELKLGKGESRFIQYSISFKTGNKKYPISNYAQAKKSIQGELKKCRMIFADIQTANEQFNHWIKRSRVDLFSLLAKTVTGKYPYAGVPWYNTPFGRDGLITAIETLWIAPVISKDVLLFLAHTQATKTIPGKDAEPGKILHEARRGEMANTGEIPFKQYYGTIDATPLFIMLAGMYFERTADIDLIKRIWPNIKAALQWINEYGDIDGDGFVEYQNKALDGLTNQGWKDSFDSVMHQNGALASAPIAICEVQAYVYSAKLHAGKLATRLGEELFGEKLTTEAQELKQQFNQQFWDSSLNCFVLALDRDKHPCRVVASNAGQCLFTGIVDDDKAPLLADTLLGSDMFSGWGIRTLSAREQRFNPMSYHNGSIWPHDNALIVYGLSLYGLHYHVAKVMRAIFDASLFMGLQRMPELYCGFERRSGEGTTAYPVACSPQAWAVGAVFLLLQACLKININAPAKMIVFDAPRLPDYLEGIQIRNLRLGADACNLNISRLHDDDVGFNLLKKPNGWEVIIRK